MRGPSLESRLNRDYNDILSALCAEGAEFLVVGAYAVGVHGIPRATGDIDIWVRPTRENATRVMRALKRFGAALLDLTEPIRKGNYHLTTALVQAAVCASKQKDCYLRDKYWRLKARRGPKRAALAVAHKILVAAYHILKDPLVEYRDLGPTYLDKLAPERTKHNLVKRLEQLGFRVTLEPAPGAA